MARGSSRIGAVFVPMAENWNFQHELCVNYNKVKPTKTALF